MAKPRILHVYKDYFPPIVGGIEMTINLMAEGMRDEFDVRVLVANREGRSEEKIINGVPVFKAACKRRIASAPLAPSMPMLFPIPVKEHWKVNYSGVFLLGIL